MSGTAETLSKYVAKPLTSFAVGGAIGAFARPGLSLRIMGKSVPAWAVAGAVCAIGTEFVGLTHDYILPHIPVLTLASAPVETGLSIGVNAAAGALTYNILAPGALSEVGIGELLMGAAAAELISGYVTELYWKPMLHQHFA
jgi:hypothetical protein